MQSRGTRGYTQSRNAWVYTVRDAWFYIVSERVDLHCLGTPGVTVTELLGIHSRGTSGLSQSRGAWV